LLQAVRYSGSSRSEYFGIRATPKKTLSTIAEAIEKRDLTTFELYVDLERFGPTLSDYIAQSNKIGSIPKESFEDVPVDYIRRAAADIQRSISGSTASIIADLRKGVSSVSPETSLLEVFPSDVSGIRVETVGKTARVHVANGCPPLLDAIAIGKAGITTWSDWAKAQDNPESISYEALILVSNASLRLWDGFIQRKFPSLSPSAALEHVKTLDKVATDDLNKEFMQELRGNHSNVHKTLTRPPGSLVFVLGQGDGIWRVVGLDAADCLRAEREINLEKMDERARDYLNIIRGDSDTIRLMRSVYWKDLTNFIARYPSRPSAIGIRDEMEKTRNTWLATKLPLRIEKAWLSRSDFGEKRIHVRVRNVSDKTITEYSVAFRFPTGNEGTTYVRPAYGDECQKGKVEEKVRSGQVAGDQNRYCKVDYRFRDPDRVKAIPVRVKFEDGTEWWHPMWQEPLLLDAALWTQASG
jgi:hypothetical protein